MHYFEKVFDGQVLKWCVNGAELGGGKPTLLCLVSNETEAESCLPKRNPSDPFIGSIFPVLATERLPII